MKITEIFYSLQGEGRLVGVPSVFIRLAGCPLRCRWCDTKYAWSKSAGQEFSIQHIIDETRQYSPTHVVVTGGEPMVSPYIEELIDALSQMNIHITVETAGIQFLPDLPVHLMSISPKLSNSLPKDPQLAMEHREKCFKIDELQQLLAMYDYQLKFVVETLADIDEIREIVKQLNVTDPTKVCLMPQSTTQGDYIEKSRWLAEMCLQTGFSFSSRLQVLLWPAQKGK